MCGFGGQPGILITGVPFGKTSDKLLAPVGLPPLEGTPPHAAQEPIAIIAAAPLAASWMCSTIGLPAYHTIDAAVFHRNRSIYD